MKPILIFTAFLFFGPARAQTNRLSGIVEDAGTHERLTGASVMLFDADRVLGGICDEQGKFSIYNPGKIDSVKITMIGYQSKIYKANLLQASFILVRLDAEPSALQGVVVRPLGVMNIVRQAVQRIPSTVPSKDFESTSFYREIIKDSLQYYSVAEAIFDIQFAVQKKSFKLKLEKGRSKEDVARSRIFEDFHPGGGPEDAVGQSLVVRRPDFLSENRLKNYIYKKDSTVKRDGRMIYVISFDEKPEVKEALEKGILYIDADDFSLLKFEARNSPVGTAYIKSLKGTDKIFAGILHIDLNVKGWTRSATYAKIRDKLFLSHAEMTYQIEYKQPKKNVDLSLNIHTELLITDFERPVIAQIKKEEEWKRKNLIVNLPADFDSAFWGNNNILSPTAEMNNIIASLSKKNNDAAIYPAPDGWEYLNRELFIAYRHADSITLLPLAKCSWEDNDTGGMIYRRMKGDFEIEARLSVLKRSNASVEPDNGFQQGGIILRSITGKGENNFIFSLGTGGNSVPKYFLKITTAGKSKTRVNKTDSMSAWLRIEKRGNQIKVLKKPDEASSWIKVEEYALPWLNDDLEAGFSVMARFAGDGPKQKPDMKAIFSAIKISGL